jgi:hypothetical protein
MRQPASVFFPARADNRHGLVLSVVLSSSWPQILTPEGGVARDPQLSDDGQSGSNQLVGRIGTEKRACSQLAGPLPVCQLFIEVTAQVPRWVRANL